MQCLVCGAPLPSGANACPTCGSAVPTTDVNAQGQLPPTAYAGPAPATNYGNTPVPPPPSYGGNPYQQGSSSPYNQPANNFQQGGYPGAPGPRAPYSPPPKKSRAGLIIAIVAVVLVIACVGTVAFAHMLAGGGTASTNSTPTATSATATATPATGNNTSPSGNPIDPQAAAIITHPQTAGDIDKSTLEPKAGTVKTTFKVNDPIYVTFNLDPNKYDVTKEKAWVNVRFYKGSESILKDDPLAVAKEETVGYFGAKYYQATSSGGAEIYWCHTSTCSDGKLAQVVHFTVTN